MSIRCMLGSLAVTADDVGGPDLALSPSWAGAETDRWLSQTYLCSSKTATSTTP